MAARIQSGTAFNRRPHKKIMAFSNVDAHFLVAEAKALEGEHLQKVFGSPTLYRFKFRSQDLVFHIPETAYLTSNPPQFTQHPNTFTMLLRKHLVGRLQKISQVNFDRIIRLDFAGASIVFELFGEGNVLLLDDFNTIIRPFRAEEFASRKLYSREKYVAPPMEKQLPDAFNADALKSLSGPIVPALAKTVNLSPLYIEQACATAGIAKTTKADSLSFEQEAKLAEALKGILHAKPDPRAYLKDGKPYLAAPFPIVTKASEQTEQASTFSEALQKVFLAKEPPKAPETDTTVRRTALLEKQAETMALFEQKADEAKKKAEWIHANSAMISRLLENSDSTEETLKQITGPLAFKKKRTTLEFEV